MSRKKLNVKKRTTLGKKVKKLRKEGILPANVYGKDIKSLPVEVSYKEFDPLFKEVGETGLIDIVVDGQLKPVLIHNVQYDHLSRIPLHADFYQVNLKEKVKAMVPINIIGEPKAVSEKLGLLMPLLSEIEIEALPEDLPENIEVNVENLAQVGDQIIVSDLKIPNDVLVLTDKSQAVAKIAELISDEAKAQAEEEKALAEAAKAETEGAEVLEGAENAPQEEPTEPEKKDEPKTSES